MRITINYDDGPEEVLEHVCGILKRLAVKYTREDIDSVVYIDYEVPDETIN